MKLNDKQLDLINKKGVIIFSTSNNNQPRSVFISPSRVEKDKFIISDVVMEKTKENLLSNEKAFILVSDEEYENWLKIEGKVSYISEGSLLEEMIKLEQQKRDFTPKGVVIFDILNITEESKEG
jgi:hypothetical protein